MTPRLVLALLASALLLTGCLSAPADIQAEFDRGDPNHYKPAGAVERDIGEPEVAEPDDEGGAR